MEPNHALSHPIDPPLAPVAAHGCAPSGEAPSPSVGAHGCAPSVGGRPSSVGAHGRAPSGASPENSSMASINMPFHGAKDGARMRSPHQPADAAHFACLPYGDPYAAWPARPAPSPQSHAPLPLFLCAAAPPAAPPASDNHTPANLGIHALGRAPALHGRYPAQPGIHASPPVGRPFMAAAPPPSMAAARPVIDGQDFRPPADIHDARDYSRNSIPQASPSSPPAMRQYRRGPDSPLLAGEGLGQASAHGRRHHAALYAAPSHQRARKPSPEEVRG